MVTVLEEKTVEGRREKVLFVHFVSLHVRRAKKQLYMMKIIGKNAIRGIFIEARKKNKWKTQNKSKLPIIPARALELNLGW